MIRLTLILAVAIFAVLVIVPGENAELADATSAPPDETRPPRASFDDSALRETAENRLVLVTADGEELEIDLVVEPSSLTQNDARVSLPPSASATGAETSDAGAGGATTAAADAEAEDAPPDPAAATQLRVTGDRVNFRAGPSTDDEILAALTVGTEVELIERVADGWVHLRVPDTGLEGYMSGDFVEPAN